MLPRDGVVIGIDLAEDKQAIAVVDHDVRVLARKTVRVKAFRLGEALDWAVGQARGTVRGMPETAKLSTAEAWPGRRDTRMGAAELRVRSGRWS